MASATQLLTPEHSYYSQGNLRPVSRYPYLTPRPAASLLSVICLLYFLLGHHSWFLSVCIMSSSVFHGVVGFTGHSFSWLNNILLWVDHLPTTVDSIVIHVLGSEQVFLLRVFLGGMTSCAWRNRQTFQSSAVHTSASSVNSGSPCPGLCKSLLF